MTATPPAFAHGECQTPLRCSRRGGRLQRTL